MSRQLQSGSAEFVADSANAMRLLDGLAVDAEHALDRWLDALGQLPMADWLAVGRADANGASSHAARARVESILAAEGLTLTGWLIRDFVATTTYPASRSARACTRQEQDAFAAARQAAVWAALAVATRSWLTDSETDTLCGPFDAVIPRGALRLV